MMKRILSLSILIGISIFFISKAEAKNKNSIATNNSKILLSDYAENDTMDVYNYPNKEWWYKNTETITSFWKFKNIYELFGSLGNVDRGWNMDDFVNSELGEGVLNLMLPWLKYPDEMSQGLLDYWAKNGIKKEMHNADDPENKWASYVPLSAYKDENKNKRYPLMFCFRGGNDPIYAAEGFGIVKYGVEAGYITVIPYNRNPEAIQKLIAEITDKYPVDKSRIYITGNGRGGYMSIVNTLANPKTFAAIAPFGIRPMLFGFDGRTSDEEVKKTTDQVEALRAVKMPFMVIDGQYDIHRHYPLSLPNRTPPQDKIDDLNTWFYINNLVADSLTPDKSEGFMINSDEWIERQTGIKFPIIKIEKRDGTNYYFGEFYDPDGLNLMSVVMVKNCNHWHGTSYPEIIWNYVKQFSRNLETGKLITQAK